MNPRDTKFSINRLFKQTKKLVWKKNRKEKDVGSLNQSRSISEERNKKKWRIKILLKLSSSRAYTMKRKLNKIMTSENSPQRELSYMGAKFRVFNIENREMLLRNRQTDRKHETSFWLSEKDRMNKLKGKIRRTNYFEKKNSRKKD